MNFRSIITENYANSPQRSEAGLSLIEIMIALAVGLVLLAALYSVFTVQSRSLKIQEQVAELQQNVRAGMDVMVREIRMAGYDPSGSGGAGIITVETDSIEFSFYDEDGNLRTIAFDRADSLGKPSLRRAVNEGTPQPVVENIDTLLFHYDAGSGTVSITLTGRTGQPDPNYTHPVYNDNYRRYSLETTVACRNLKP